MSINFFEAKCTREISCKSFGLCDDQNSKPVRIDICDKSKWNAIIENNNKQKITFIALDHCIPICRANGDADTCCDGLMLYEGGIIFIELKNKGSKWISEGVDQLMHTIKLFKENHDISCYKNKRAFLANKKHPRFQIGQEEKMKQFTKALGVRLHIVNKINI